MISILIFCHKRKDADILYSLCGYWTAVTGDEILSAELMYDCNLLSDAKNGDYLIEGLGIRQLPDMIFFELAEEQDFLKLESVRKQFPESSLLIMTYQSISPERYLTPFFHPVALLMYPLDREKVSNIIRQMFIYHYNNREKALHTRKLVIRCGTEKRYFDYTQIIYMESREKKIYLYYGPEEIDFYGSLKNIELSLPKYFIRCHRSYIINFMFIKKMNISQNVFYMQNKIVIPISKKYKNNINSILHKNFAGRFPDETDEW